MTSESVDKLYNDIQENKVWFEKARFAAQKDAEERAEIERKMKELDPKTQAELGKAIKEARAQGFSHPQAETDSNFWAKLRKNDGNNKSGGKDAGASQPAQPAQPKPIEIGKETPSDFWGKFAKSRSGQSGEASTSASGGGKDSSASQSWTPTKPLSYSQALRKSGDTE